jgi:cell division protein FtsW
MIFTVIVEELGVFGAVCVVIMFMVLLWRMMFIANHAKDMFGSFLVIGIMIHVSLQIILNIAVASNAIPNTGVTLPFISYGGTSLIILLAEMGIVLSVSRDIPLDQTEL